MYGRKGAYFSPENKAFHNSVWIELIGFEKDSPDHGVQHYLDTISFHPDSISLHLTSIDFVNTHRGMDEAYVLPPYACSYGGHAENDERKRQDWTNYDLRSLVKNLHAHQIQVFASFFDLCTQYEPDDFTVIHPELLADGPSGNEKSLMVIKRFSDGSYYEDYLLKKLLEVVSDYGFDGVQLADGISSPRNAIWFADFTEDILEQSGVYLPPQADPRSYIPKYLRKEWLAFYRNRWSAFLRKIIGGLKQAGALVAVNSAWTRDPLEALYRYGADYRVIAEAGADFFIVEDVSSDLAILSDEDNCGYAFSYEERKLIHYEFVANLMCIRAHSPEFCITPLFMIWDNQEQWNVIHHAPTAMQRAAAANFSHFAWQQGVWKPITDGPHFCLGDALQARDWDFIRLSIDNGYTPAPISTEGAAFLWSSRRMERELEQLVSCGRVHSARWLALLLRSGAAIQKIIDVSQLSQLTGDVVVANVSLLPDDERKIVEAYRGGRVIAFDAPTDPAAETVCNPKLHGWPRPLDFTPVDDAMLATLTETINFGVNARLQTDSKRCTIREIRTGANTSRIFVENNEYYYVLPQIRTQRSIRRIRIITKPDGYPLQWDVHGFCVRVPGRGVDIAEIEYDE